jgi:hypothetical protein
VLGELLDDRFAPREPDRLLEDDRARCVEGLRPVDLDHVRSRIPLGLAPLVLIEEVEEDVSVAVGEGAGRMGWAIGVSASHRLSTVMTSSLRSKSAPRNPDLEGGW